MKEDISEFDQLVYEYLLDRGLEHSAFVFHKETCLKERVLATYEPKSLLDQLEKARFYERMEEEIINEVVGEEELSVKSEEKMNLREIIRGMVAEELGTQVSMASMTNLEPSHQGSFRVRKPVVKLFSFDHGVVILYETDAKLAVVYLDKEDLQSSKLYPIPSGVSINDVSVTSNELTYLASSTSIYSFRREDSLSAGDFREIYKTDEGTEVCSMTQENDFLKICLKTPSSVVLLNNNGLPVYEEIVREVKVHMSVVGILEWTTDRSIITLYSPEGVQVNFETESPVEIKDCGVTDNEQYLIALTSCASKVKSTICCWTVVDQRLQCSVKVKGIFTSIIVFAETVLCLNKQELMLLRLSDQGVMSSLTFTANLKSFSKLSETEAVLEIYGGTVLIFDVLTGRHISYSRIIPNADMLVCRKVRKVLEFGSMDNYKIINI